MEANISNYYVPNENNQISISKTSIVSRGRVKILGTKNDDEYDQMVPIGLWDWPSNNSNYQDLLRYFDFDNKSNEELLSIFHDEIGVIEVDNSKDNIEL